MKQRMTKIQDEFEQCDGLTWRLRRTFSSYASMMRAIAELCERYTLSSLDFVYDVGDITVYTDSGPEIVTGWTLTYAGDIPSDACAHPAARTYAWMARDDTAKNGRVLCVACCDCGKSLAGGV